MAIPVEMPKMSDTMEEGVLVAWMAEEGDTVSAGDVIAQVETDKATMDLEVYDDGVLLKKMIGEGDSVPIGGLIAVLGKAGEDVSSIMSKYVGGDGKAVAAPATSEASVPVTESVSPVISESAVVSSGDGATSSIQPEPAVAGRLKASPLAKRIAREHAIDLNSVQGSGPEGRIVKRDVEEVMAKAPEVVVKQPAVSAAVSMDAASYEAIRISQMRKTISKRLSQSKFTAPHFYLTVDVEMENVIAFRKQLNELAQSQDRGKVSFNDFITKSCALALRQHPYVNASYLAEEGEIRLHNVVNVAIAVAVDEGLVTPVIRNADQKGLGQIAEETKSYAAKAREKAIQPADMEGSTFTTSNLGMFGIEEFTAIINPPNACILAIGAIRETPVVKDGEIVVGKRMKLSLSCDHRVVDGATGAQFLNTVKGYLEDPMNLLL